MDVGWVLDGWRMDGLQKEQKIINVVSYALEMDGTCVCGLCQVISTACIQFV